MKITEDVLSVLSNCETNGKELHLKGNLDRTLYTKVNKVLEACGGKWNKKAKAHIFEQDATERLDQILLTGEVEIPKDDFDFFPTPKEIVEKLLVIADVKEGMLVLEPSAGLGAIALPLANLGAKVDCYEIAKTNFESLKANTQLNVMNADFLEVAPVAKFDLIVMNPPFGQQKDIKHVNHALKFLKPSGKLISVMNSSILWRENKQSKEFRDVVMTEGYFQKLPSQSFKETGTLVGTLIAVINK